ncbi:MAG: response regulator [Eubacterium sp.]|nr:response regulator [Eubacterium sp.]
MILVVENEKDKLDNTCEMIKKQRGNEEIKSFDNSPAALKFARKNKVEIAFIDVKLPEMDGFVLGQYLKDLNKYVNLIYITDDKADAFGAMEIRASGCMLEPATDKTLKKEFDELRFKNDRAKKTKVFAQTFGNFDLFVDGKPIQFKYSKTKEILALLINNRGSQTTNGEIIASLWEDDEDSKASYLSNLRQDLQNTLMSLGISDILVKQRGSMGIAVDMIECDLYDWLEKKKESRYHYLGDYMNQYSWAEYVHAEIDNISYAMEDEEY